MAVGNLCYCYRSPITRCVYRGVTELYIYKEWSSLLTLLVLMLRAFLHPFSLTLFQQETRNCLDIDDDYRIEGGKVKGFRIC